MITTTKKEVSQSSRVLGRQPQPQKNQQAQGKSRKRRRERRRSLRGISILLMTFVMTHILDPFDLLHVHAFAISGDSLLPSQTKSGGVRPWKAFFAHEGGGRRSESSFRLRVDKEEGGGDYPTAHRNKNIANSPGQMLEKRIMAPPGGLVYCHQPTITPYHILHPRVSPSVFEYPVEPKPMYRALSLIRHALAAMTTLDTNGFPSLVRMEHPITVGSFDPLAWISAQHQRLESILSSSSESYFYCQNQEGDVEVAAIGAIDTCNVTNQVWSFLERPDWPHSSRWYGGQRFDSSFASYSSDTQHKTPQSPEWKDYGSNAWWFLPTIELRREGNQMILSVHVIPDKVQQTLDFIQQVNDQCMEQRPPTTLPPVLSRSSGYKQGDGSSTDGQELYEEAVSKAIEQMEETREEGEEEADNQLKKVVLARVQRMSLGVDDFCALSVLRRWKYGDNEGGHLFWMQPGKMAATNSNNIGGAAAAEFFGCAPERLFRVQATDPANPMVQSEALAGTRPRGSTVAEDTQLLQELLQSPKDRHENQITGDFVCRVFSDMQEEGLILPKEPDSDPAQPSDRLTMLKEEGSPETPSNFFVRRLLHLQHLCQSFEAKLSHPNQAFNVARFLLTNMHPTPAVCGVPVKQAEDFIRKYESVGFDRGFYAGPVGYIGLDASDVFVALRSALLTKGNEADTGERPKSSLLVYAGGGIVPGSTVKGEWAETNYKLAVISSVFPQSPMTLQGAQTPNVAWATAFLEELIRNGITQFYVCPGSRSTPLVVALSRAARSRVGVVHVASVHDERSAAFRAVGYARGANRPAAVVTSSGTAVANLYPAVVEAGMDGVPLLLLTADRPYENRDTGANQAIDQVKMFSSAYTRWFRDILPPSDDVPISLALSDAGHAVNVARNARGPVHLNIQFRENLAPDAGPIRNDGRTHSTTRFDALRFTETPHFDRWSITGKTFTRNMKSYSYSEDSEAARELSQLISKSRRGIIVVGNTRPSLLDEGESHIDVADAISDFAQHIGFPIFAGAQQVALRFRSPAVVLFAEHLLKCPEVANNLKPDLVIQIGAPLVSSEIPSIIARTCKDSVHETSHVLIHPFSPSERIDPSFTVTHHISADSSALLKRVASDLVDPRGSQLSTLVMLGKRLQSRMKRIIQHASRVSARDEAENALSEPEVILAVAESYSTNPDSALFLSNSMPIRDSEFFLYPFTDTSGYSTIPTGTNRGASGIDGIISSAVGFAEATGKPTTLLIGDVSALHDIGSLHNLAEQTGVSKQRQSKRPHPISTVVINNDGGGIFSFLPIARHGQDVSFNDLFGTPTNSFSFEKGAKAYGIDYKRATEFESLINALSPFPPEGGSTLIEVVVGNRESNVLVHRQISNEVASFVEGLLAMEDPAPARRQLCNLKTYSNDFLKSAVHEQDQTLVLLHGWMGDKTDWDEVGLSLSGLLPPSWSVKSVDLAGHGDALQGGTLELESIRRSLNLPLHQTNHALSVRQLTDTVVESLRSNGVRRLDALAGYSLGGRVALDIYDRFAGGDSLIHNETKLVLVSSFTESKDSTDSGAGSDRIARDERLSETIRFCWFKSRPHLGDMVQRQLCWENFLDSWYSSAIWGNLQSSPQYPEMKRKRSKTLERRGPELADILSRCSPPRNRRSLAAMISPSHTFLLAGILDKKYCDLGRKWQKEEGVRFEQVERAGHALLLEAPLEVAERIAGFLNPKDECVSRVSSLRQIAEPLTSSPGQSGNDLGTMSARYRLFSVDFLDSSGRKGEVGGLGWGDRAEKSRNLSSRRGLLLQFESKEEDNVVDVGIGEVTPLGGVHEETLEAAEAQIQQLMAIIDEEGCFDFDPSKVVELRGYINEWLATNFPDIKLLPSVRSGVEMALLGLAAHKIRTPLHQAILRAAGNAQAPAKCFVEVNGLLTRSFGGVVAPLSFKSLKVKVGHQAPEEDIDAIRAAIDLLDAAVGQGNGRLRLDANCAWSWDEASNFNKHLVDLNVHDRIEFVEEPLSNADSSPFEARVEELESWFLDTGVRYALDESLAAAAQYHSFQFSSIKEELLRVFQKGRRGCAALVLKPSLLGIELSMQLARLARKDLRIGAVFSSSFESGVGLTYSAFLAAASDALECGSQSFAHGLGTYALLDGDTMSPAFSSYMNSSGQLNAASVSRAIYGLTLDELVAEQPDRSKSEDVTIGSGSGDHELKTSVSLLLPFSAKTAHNRFTDLPQQPRWCPWLSSVSYQGEETEWKIRIRGIALKWRAKSQLLDRPWLGIEWESVSGVSNCGTVQFIPTNSEECEMKVHIAIVPPVILSPLFRRAKSVLLEDFLRDKIILWSLEMFRDVVKADLAIECGDVELGDALYGAVEGKASAIEATLKSS